MLQKSLDGLKAYVMKYNLLPTTQVFQLSQASAFSLLY